MDIQTLRIYCEVYEQGLETRDYFSSILSEKNIESEINIVYVKKVRGEFLPNESIVTRIRKIKDIDIMVTAITDNKEIPIVLLEYSTAVPTDDHIMQRSDVVYWGAKFKVPSLKISPLNKGMANEHGGGDKITDDFEKRVAIKNKAVYYTLKWECNKENDVLLTNESRLSCIPYSEMLKKYYSKLIEAFVESENHFEYFDCLFKEYCVENAALNKNLQEAEIKEMFPSSKRFTWTKSGLMTKINRFGHAMDPERGAIYFCNMINGTAATSAEFQIERENILGRGGYNSLFDMTANKDEMLKYVSNHKENFSSEDAKNVFFKGLGIDKYFKKVNISDGNVVLDDEEMIDYLKKSSGFALKSIFILTSNIVLTDKKRNVLLNIQYNRKVIDDYVEILSNFTYDITPIKQLSSQDINEDIVTFASAHLLKKAGMKILAISYPGAQGDRCMLIGKGRKVKREYIDLIAYSKAMNDTIILALHESKEKISLSAKDITKLNAIISSPELIASLKKLTLKIIGNDAISTINIGIGGKGSRMPVGANLDYVMLFDINKCAEETIVLWSIGVINTKMLDQFEKLMDGSGKLCGDFHIDPIYCIK